MAKIAPCIIQVLLIFLAISYSAKAILAAYSSTMCTQCILNGFMWCPSTNQCMNYNEVCKNGPVWNLYTGCSQQRMESAESGCGQVYTFTAGDTNTYGVAVYLGPGQFCPVALINAQSPLAFNITTNITLATVGVWSPDIPNTA